MIELGKIQTLEVIREGACEIRATSIWNGNEDSASGKESILKIVM
jgi:hypothetical protein